MWSNQKKTFQQKFRVFSAAFWQNNDTSFDLEKSDKIVLPPSAINALTDCNASFPVLLKIQIIDSSSNKPLPSNIFSYVIDYSAPEGLVYMSSWMITKLQLDQSGQSVIELNLPTSNNLKYQCPSAEFLQLQPHSLQLMLLDNITSLVHKSLSDYYSSLRIGDEITVYSSSSNKEYQLTVTKISSKETPYTPKCVRLNNNINDNNLMLGFSEPKNYELENNNNNDHDDKKEKGKAIKKEEKEDDNDNDNDDDIDINDDIEWEIVSVEKVQSISELSWKEPILIKNINGDNKALSNKEIEAKQPPIVQPQPQPKVEPEPEPEPEPEAKTVITVWDCPKCGATNEFAYKFCPKCGCNQNQWKPPAPAPAPLPAKKKEKKEETSHKEEKKVSGDDIILLKKMSVINDGTYSCGEDRQTGWIVKNISNRRINVKGKLVKFAGSNDVQLKYDDIMQFDMKAGDEMFVMIEVKAPLKPHQYHIFCQLLNDENKQRICEVLSLPVIVKSEFSDKKEEMINQICEMGFMDRKKIITALKKWNWDELKAINWLATH